MSKVYLVKFVLEVCEEIEADSEEDAKQTFSEMFDNGEALLEYGEYVVEDLTA